MTKLSIVQMRPEANYYNCLKLPQRRQYKEDAMWAQYERSFMLIIGEKP